MPKSSSSSPSLPSRPSRLSPLLQQRAKLKAAHAAADAGNLKPLAAMNFKPIPDSMKGTARGAKGSKPGGAGRPRTGNKTIQIAHNGEIGAGSSHLDVAYNRFLEGIDETELQTAFAMQPGPDDPRRNKWQRALQILTMPNLMKDTRRTPAQLGKQGSWSLTKVLKTAGITLPEVMDVYGRYRTAQAVRIAMDRAPQIVSHMADDAENRKVVCARCDGLGTLDMDAAREEVESKRRKAVIRTCPECKGSGETVQSGDSDARKLVLEVAGIAGKKGPVVDARSVHYGHGVFSVESLVRGMESMENPPPVHDAAAIEDGSIQDAETEENTLD